MMESSRKFRENQAGIAGASEKNGANAMDSSARKFLPKGRLWVHPVASAT
jgi:hypothetical protein